MKFVYEISEDDVNAITQGLFGRDLTEKEMEQFKRKFTIDDWSDYVEFTLEEIGIK